jgi:hypothetical protein
MKKLLALIVMSVMAFASEYKVGDSISPMKLVDQFGVLHSLDKTPKTIIMTFEKEPSSKVHKFLATKSNDFLQTNNATFIADITGMPAFVTKMFALPKMRTYNHPILLITDENLGERFPAEDDKITIIKSENSKIKSISFVSSISSL